MTTNIEYTFHPPVDIGPPPAASITEAAGPPFRDHLTTGDANQRRQEGERTVDDVNASSSGEGYPRVADSRDYELLQPDKTREDTTEVRSEEPAAEGVDLDDEQQRIDHGGIPIDVAALPSGDETLEVEGAAAQQQPKLNTIIDGNEGQTPAGEHGDASTKGERTQLDADTNRTAERTIGHDEAKVVPLPAAADPEVDTDGEVVAKPEVEAAEQQLPEKADPKANTSSQEGELDADDRVPSGYGTTGQRKQKRGDSREIASPSRAQQTKTQASPSSEIPDIAPAENSQEAKQVSHRRPVEGAEKVGVLEPTKTPSAVPVRVLDAKLQRTQTLLDSTSEEAEGAVAASTGSSSKSDPPVDRPTPHDSAGARADVAIAPTEKAEGVHDRLSSVLSANRGSQPRSQGPLTDSQQARLIDRVTKAFDVARARGESAVRLRLSPPHLGSLTLEMQIESGSLIARLEVETQSAREVLLDNLNTLRQRLAEQSIRVDQFDVDLLDRQPDDPWQRDEQLKSHDREGSNQRQSERLARRDDAHTASQSSKIEYVLDEGAIDVVV